MMHFKNRKSCFIVAEISANHGQSFDRAISLIKSAKECGVDAVKFQAYLPGRLTIDIDNRYFRIRHPKWGGQTLYELYKKAYTPWSWFKRLKRIADDLGLAFFSTAFDKTSVDFLEELNIPIHKISSFELVDLPLVEYVARTMKPLILSTGMATVPEIKDAVEIAKGRGAKDLALLRCVSSYPARPEEMNLKTIPDMEKLFRCPVGLSDHTLGIAVPIAAVSLGAKIIEKHFTLSRRLKTPDNFFSLEPQEFKSLVECIRAAEKSIGRVCYKLAEGERRNRIFRRSLFVVRDIQKGEVFSEENVRSIRPGYGAAPKYLESILGKRSKRRVLAGTPLRFNMVDNFKIG